MGQTLSEPVITKVSLSTQPVIAYWMGHFDPSILLTLHSTPSYHSLSNSTPIQEKMIPWLMEYPKCKVGESVSNQTLFSFHVPHLQLMGFTRQLEMARSYNQSLDSNDQIETSILKAHLRKHCHPKASRGVWRTQNEEDEDWTSRSGGLSPFPPRFK